MRNATDTIRVTEAQAERAVIELLELYGWQVRRMREDIHNRDGYGIPDLLCTSGSGVQVWVEMKRPATSRNPRGRVRKAQREVLAEWRRRGVPCCVADGASEALHELALNGAGDRSVSMRLCDEMMAGYSWWPANDVAAGDGGEDPMGGEVS